MSLKSFVGLKLPYPKNEWLALCCISSIFTCEIMSHHSSHETNITSSINTCLSHKDHLALLKTVFVSDEGSTLVDTHHFEVVAGPVFP